MNRRAFLAATATLPLLPGLARAAGAPLTMQASWINDAEFSGYFVAIDQGYFTAEGLDSVATYPVLFAELIRRGWSDANLAKLAGGNVLRALRRAEDMAVRMTHVPPALSPLTPTP